MMMEPPVGRLPPLRVLHEQPALDLDTPPPSPGTSSESLAVPVIARSPSPLSTSSSSTQYSGEEIEHSIRNLAQCYQILQPGQHPCLCTHGRVSSAFSHNKYSVTLAEHYSTLQRLMVSRSRLHFARECASRVSQLAEFVQSLQVVAHEEYNTLQALQTGGDVEPYTKLEYLAVFCEDLRIHMNNWTSIQHRLYSDKYLQSVMPELCRDLSDLQRSLVYWRDCALWWLQQIIAIGLRIFAHCSPNTATQDMLWSIVRGTENYNGMLALIKGHQRHPVTTLPSHQVRYRCLRFKIAEASSRFTRSFQLFSVSRILSILSKERSKLASLQILFFLMRNQSFIHISKQPPQLFDWRTYPCMASVKTSRSSSEPEAANPSAATGSLLTLRDLKAQGLLQETSPQCAIETQEEGFISKLLTAVSASTGLLQKHRPSASTDEGSNQTATQKLAKLKSPRRNGGKHDTRKSVRWGDSFNARIQHEYFNLYMDMMWRCCGDELRDLLHRPGLGLAEIALDGIMSLGHVYQCSDALVVALGHLIEQTCGKGVFTAGASQSLQSISRQLISDVAFSQCRSGICHALACSFTDKCFAVSGPSSINQGSKTCQLFQVSLLPLLSLLSAAEHQHSATKVLPRGASRNGVTPAIQSPSTQTLHQALSLSIMVLEASRHWCLTKGNQFLASWSVNKFLLVSQSDLKITLDSSVHILQACQWLSSSASKEVHQSTTHHKEKDAARLEELKLKLDAINSRLHITSSELLQVFGQHCSQMCADVWQQGMPMGKVWRKKTTDDLPTEHNPYVPAAVNTILVPLVEGVSNLRISAQIAIISVTVTNMLEMWMAHVLREKPKFSVHGAHQLSQDVAYVRTWLMSDSNGLELQTRQSMLTLDAFRHFEGAISLLKHQPRRRGINSPTRDDANSEYSSSTVPSSAGSHQGSVSSLSDTLPPGGTNTVGEPLALGNGSDMGESGFEEEIFRVPHRKEWLSLRVHGNQKWRLLPFGCLNVGVDS
ncbi:uncharacterized protein LOC119739669 [Patiria miniata]|uniref:Coiled-coil protein 142 C-terminal domain-containing protein n=1 Tax=Patiria miniata TaxID=46514 RepID=A0A914B473_PATMI|nr:uncharacterized protein LOC119739669 [Patiria miniata]XP_038070610.1 uncharacterized protein LOC119739669 [Patiria miniata]